MLKTSFTILRILIGIASLTAFALTLMGIAIMSFFTMMGNGLAPLAQIPRFFTHGLHDPGPILHHTYLYLLPLALLAALYLVLFLSILTTHRRIVLHAVAAAAACATVWTLASPPEAFLPILLLWFAYYAICLFFNPLSTGEPPPPHLRRAAPWSK